MRTVRIYQQGVWCAGDQVTLSQPASDHVLSVLRLRVGCSLILFDGEQQIAETELIAVHKRRAVVQIQKSQTLPDEQEPLSLHLVVAWLHTRAVDFIVQKSVELGVRSLSMVMAERSVGGLKVSPAHWERKHRHWQRIIINACEQCGQYRMPELSTAQRGLRQWAYDHVQSDRLVCFLTLDGLQSLRQTYQAHIDRQQWVIVIGPEGGWSECEKACAAEYGWSQVHMGSRVLRAETAALAALASLQCLSGA